MDETLSRRDAIVKLAAGGAVAFAGPLGVVSSNAAEHSRLNEDYQLQFSFPWKELVGDLERTERGDPHRQSQTPYHEWYSRHIRHRFGSWGPTPRHYLVLEGLQERPLEWKRERVVAVASRYIGYGYQHHHIPDWDPPTHWPWKETCVGHNGKGVDCSNFTSFVYNQGFGLRMNSEVVHQSEARRALENHEHSLAIRQIDLPFIRGREEGPITHVIIWMGAVGRAKNDVPLILDSHGGDVKDEEGRPIPCGIHLRPFRETSWYNRCASHAHRIFHS